LPYDPLETEEEVVVSHKWAGSSSALQECSTGQFFAGFSFESTKYNFFAQWYYIKEDGLHFTGLCSLYYSEQKE
jgi:hypothetical protein